MSEILFQIRAAWVIAKKNARVYYLKPPVLTFGIIFPFFFFLAFATGHDAPVAALAPGIVAMALFFTASAVGPLITPWERQARTYERLATSPAALTAILGGDMISGAAFGALLCLLPLAATLLGTSAAIVRPDAIVLGIVLGALSFAALGVLLAAPATQAPSQVMMLSNLVRLPVIFVSGVFVPIDRMPVWGRALAPFSPLSYCSDLIRTGYGEQAYWAPSTDAFALIAFIAAFMAAAIVLHRRARHQGI